MYILDFVNLGLTVCQTRATHSFHAIDPQIACHLLLEWSWIHNHKVAPYMYHQCLKDNWTRRRVHIDAMKSPSQIGESTFQKWLILMNSLMSRNNPDQAEDLEGKGPKPDHSAYTSNHHPRPTKQPKQISRKGHIEGMISWKVCLADGRTCHLLWHLRGQALLGSKP